MNPERKIALLILAAGASKRMKAVKQLLPWKNTTLLGNAIEKGIASDVDQVFVVLGANYENIKESITHFPVEIIRNDDWKSGMSTSIVNGITHIMNQPDDYDAIMVGLADTPLLDVDHFNALIETSANSLKNIIATKCDDVIGVPAIFPDNYFKVLKELKGDQGARKIIKLNKEQVTSINAGEKCKDIDTPEAYKKIIKTINR
ncbi:NTP transferase domain-containing protein [Flavobacteriaceae bacterium R38]|nr:NTP transferase domain-containing protein [Flavobacteriaceae bacterium R38]